MSRYPTFRPRSWGRYPRTQARAVPVFDRHAAKLPDVEGSLLAYGNGRSYGDVALNDGEHLLLTRGLDRFIAFDERAGVLTCEAGVLLDDILQLVVPRGWFIPVTPGTRHVTVGGAIANDVHGKNHHRRGSFGNHLRRFRLLRSDVGVLDCEPGANAGLFSATIGGLGLTGLILSAEMQLMPMPGPYLLTETRCFDGLDEFLDLSAASEPDWEYTVAWVDCAGTHARQTRGVFYRARHSDRRPTRSYRPKWLPSIPAAFPVSIVNRWTVRAFNGLYYRAASSRNLPQLEHYLPFFYPLDGVPGWNALYGPKGFLQHQCVIPPDSCAIRDIFDAVFKEKQGSFLAVLKVFGAVESKGMLSFPRPGVTLALDFPIRGTRTFEFLEQLDRIVVDAGGAVYPAKDARMSPQTFNRGFPRSDEFARYRDAKFDSSFWRRVGERG